MDVAAQLNALLAGRYSIERAIGAGGMATVYLARDAKHNRKVALKVLKPELGIVLGAERFLTEIETTANLQHPHILPLFDSGEAGGLLYFVMPYVEGETLHRRLERERQLPVDEAIRIAVAVASALDYAHRRGVIHRDLKPENILLHDGQPLVADFGIALAVSNAGGARVTQTGLSLGTPQYMSPEQATGDRTIDARSDLYSLAAVLYEMLTGDPPHTASTVQAIIAKVLTEQPQSVRVHRTSVPEHVDAAILQALSKLPADRFSTAGEFAEALTGARPVARTVALSAAVPTRHRVRDAMLGAALTVALASALAFAMWPRTTDTRSPLLFEIAFPDNTIPVFPEFSSVDISKDGSHLAFSARRPGIPGYGIYLRRFDSQESHLIPGTERGVAPRFSPAGDWIAFRVQNQLRKVALTGGAVTTLADSLRAGHDWTDTGDLLYGTNSGLWRVPAAGGARQLVTASDTSRDHLFYGSPHALPGGKAALVVVVKRSADPSGWTIGAVKLPTGVVQDFELRGTSAVYVPGNGRNNGYIVVGQTDGSLLAAPFDADRLRILRPAVPVLSGLFVGGTPVVDFAVSENGALIYRPGNTGGSQLVAVNPTGAMRVLLSESRRYQWPRVSPDGRRIALTILEGTKRDIWVWDTPSRTLSRLTTTGGERPEWTVDGRRIAFVANDSTENSFEHLRWAPWDGSAPPDTLIKNDGQVEEISFGPPGTFLAVRWDPPDNRGGSDIWLAHADSPKAVRPFLSTAATEGRPRISPNGRLIAYVSNESGRTEVYVRPLPGPGPRLQVSTAGANEPVWSRDGQRVFYRSQERPSLMSATIGTSPELSVVRRDSLFPDVFLRNGSRAFYDVFPNGDFVFVLGDLTSNRLMYFTNWDVALRKRLEAERTP